MSQSTIANGICIAAFVALCGCANAPPERNAPLTQAAASFDSEFPRVVDKVQAEIGHRPRTKFVAVTMEPRVGVYVERCLMRILATSEKHYPPEIKGLHGKTQLTTVIRTDGSLALVGVNRTSGNVLLDRAAVRLVQMASPFEPFPSDLRSDTDLLALTRTFTFTTKDDKSSADDAPLWKPLSVQ